MTQQGGTHSAGVLFSYNRSTGIYDTLHNFNASVLQGPTGDLIEDNGKLYGLVSTGGTTNSGYLFSYDTLSGAYDTLHNFIAATGYFPFGGLLKASDGKFYGMAYIGGSSFNGVIFRFDPATNTYDNIFDFDGINGQGPYGSLMQASNGKLYGMTKTGSGYGNIFSFDLTDSTFTNLHVLNGTDGRDPYGGLAEKSGLLYGLTSAGGANGAGVLFSIDTAGNNFTVLLDFDGALHGSSPRGTLFKASNGILYGMTGAGGTYGAGTIFSYTTQVNVLRNLNTTTDANYPQYGNFIEINNSATGTDNLSLPEQALSVYPNPAHDSLQHTCR